MEPYQVLVIIEILQLAKLPRVDRDKLLRFLDSLGSDPERKGDYEERDDVGRSVQIKVLGKHALPTGPIMLSKR